jgi:hypothetical protein
MTSSPWQRQSGTPRCVTSIAPGNRESPGFVMAGLHLDTLIATAGKEQHAIHPAASEVVSARSRALGASRRLLDCRARGRAARRVRLARPAWLAFRRGGGLAVGIGAVGARCRPLPAPRSLARGARRSSTTAASNGLSYQDGGHPPSSVNKDSPIVLGEALKMVCLISKAYRRD